METDLHRFLDRALFRFELATLGALLLITLLQPATGRTGIPLSVLVALFLGFTLVMEFVRNRVAALHAFAHKYILSLLASACIYFLGAEPGGPLFVLFFLDVACAAASLTLHSSLVYTAVVAAFTLVIDPTFPQWAPATGDVRDLGARLVLLALFGGGLAILRQRLLLEQTAAHAVREQAERLEELDQLRASFIATVSHDLRTPLTASRATLVLLATSAYDRHRPDERALLDNARRNIERLGLLIDDLLTHNQLEAGTLCLDREPLDLREVITEAMATVYPLMEEKGQPVEVDLPELLPIVGDPRRLEQVVLNLLANAHRYTPAGTRITIEGRGTDADVLLAVRDTGPGIPAEELEAIFERFHRLPSTESGSGLGLAIARAIIELHGGRIWAQSRMREGTTMWVTLPRMPHGEAQ